MHLGLDHFTAMSAALYCLRTTPAIPLCCEILKSDWSGVVHHFDITAVLRVVLFAVQITGLHMLLFL